MNLYSRKINDDCNKSNSCYNQRLIRTIFYSFFIIDFLILCYSSQFKFSMLADGILWFSSIVDGTMCNIDSPHLRYSSCFYQTPVFILIKILSFLKLEMDFEIIFTFFCYGLPLLCYFIGFHLCHRLEHKLLLASLYLVTIPTCYLFSINIATDSICFIMIYWPLIHMRMNETIKLLITIIFLSILFFSYEMSVILCIPVYIRLYRAYRKNEISKKIFSLNIIAIITMISFVVLNLLRIYQHAQATSLQGIIVSIERLYTEHFVWALLSHIAVWIICSYPSKLLRYAIISITLLLLFVLAGKHNLFNPGNILVTQFDLRLLAIPFASFLLVLSLYHKFRYNLFPLFLIFFIVKQIYMITLAHNYSSLMDKEMHSKTIESRGSLFIKENIREKKTK